MTTTAIFAARLAETDEGPGGRPPGGPGRAGQKLLGHVDEAQGDPEHRRDQDPAEDAAGEAVVGRREPEPRQAQRGEHQRPADRERPPQAGHELIVPGVLRPLHQTGEHAPRGRPKRLPAPARRAPHSPTASAPAEEARQSGNESNMGQDANKPAGERGPGVAPLGADQSRTRILLVGRWLRRAGSPPSVLRKIWSCPSLFIPVSRQLDCWR